MKATIQLLDKYKKAAGISSDNACAISLGVSRQAVSKWRNGENQPDADSVEKMCKATGEPLAKTLSLVEADRARSPSVRDVWLRLAKAATACALLYAISHLDGQTGAVASVLLTSGKPGTLYIM